MGANSRTGFVVKAEARSLTQERHEEGFDSASNYRLHNFLCECFAENIAADVRAGLAADPKSLPSKYLYDARGSELFDRICALPEYYQTRTEMGLIGDIAHDLAASLAECDLVELGSGSARKIGLLFEAMNARTLASVRYLPVDVCLAALANTCQELSNRFPELEIDGFGADFTQQLDVLPDGRPKVFFLFGSTIGNLDEKAADAFYAELVGTMRPGDRFLIGVDMVKPKAVVEAAYNDSHGVTAEFNRNVLRVVNRELDADFAPESFEHVAFYDSEREQVEMHLRAPRPLSARIEKLDLELLLERGETIQTEICRKFTREAYERRIEHAGFRVREWHSDAKNYFCLVDLVRV
jgi:L-histidine N-alpha-methyltransferase